MASIQNDLVEIRRTVYGRDMRKPLADALGHLKDKYGDKDILLKRLGNVETELVKDTADWYEYILTPVYINYEGVSSYANNLTLTNISGDDYLLTDTKPADGIELILGDEYELQLLASTWSADEMEYESFNEVEKIKHSDTYLMILSY